MDFMDSCDSDEIDQMADLFRKQYELGKQRKQVRHLYNSSNFHAVHLGGFSWGFNAIPETKKKLHLSLFQHAVIWCRFGSCELF